MSYRIAPSPSLLAYHFFSVAFYAIWVMFTHARTIPSLQNGSAAKPRSTVPRFDQYPSLAIKSVRVVRLSHSPLKISPECFQFWTACVVFGPLLWTEIRWWSDSDPSKRINLLLLSMIPVVLMSSVAIIYGLPDVGLL